MKAETGEELVNLVEARCQIAPGAGWDYPMIVERLEELADMVRDAIECGVKPVVTMHEDDLALLAGLAQVLSEALEQ